MLIKKKDIAQYININRMLIYLAVFNNYYWSFKLYNQLVFKKNILFIYLYDIKYTFTSNDRYIFDYLITHI